VSGSTPGERRFERTPRPPSGRGMPGSPRPDGPEGATRPYDPEQTRRRLGDLAVFASQAAEIVAAGPNAFHDTRGWQTRAAATYLIIEIATVGEKLHSKVRDHFDQVPWRRIARMRNIAAHRYDGVNDEIVWDVLAVFVPQLVRDLGLPAKPGDPIVLPPGLDTA
jgi:uncharacterized protein with HEPN domain